ncbi:hypothetical protein [Fodinibius sp.]|uniref:hypothetical protein n=1 Tax=Fodinibius sp. TaxID=1872440 RepID=UPI003565E72C
MDLNTKEVIRNLQLWGGGLALLTIGGIVYSISKGIMRYKKYHRKFDSNAIEEVEGRVAEVVTDSGKFEQTRGVVLVVDTNRKGIIHVHLGPEWFLLHQRKHFKPGDMVIARGSLIEGKGEEFMVAASVSRGNEVLVLRNEKGEPYWNRWMRE